MSSKVSLVTCLLVVPILLSGCLSVQPEGTVSSNDVTKPLDEEKSTAVEETSPPKKPWAFDWDLLESRIIELTTEAMHNESPSELYQLKSRLVRIHTDGNDEKATSRDYWTAVLNTNLILVEQEHGDSSQVARLLDETIELLKVAEYATAERNALLAMLYRTQIDHDSGRKFELFSHMLDALDRAVAADPMNLRVLLAKVFIGVAPVAGFSLDIDVQTSIDSALSANYVTEGHAKRPTWGLAQLYSLAIGRLMESEKITEASELVAEAIEKFPNDYYLEYWAQLFAPVPTDTDP